MQLLPTEDLNMTVDPRLRPFPPDPSSEQSMQIYQQHEELMGKYLQIQMQIAQQTDFLKQLEGNLKETEPTNDQEMEVELQKLEREKESLIKLIANLKQQLDMIRKARKGDADTWVYVERAQSSNPPKNS